MNKQSLTQLIGPLPPKVSLDPEVIETIDCGTYIRERVAYDVEKAERIHAYVLIPKKKNDSSRLPAIFCHHQHASQFDIGKSEVVGLKGDPDQAYAVELAERGFICIAPDAIAFEERNWSTESGKCEYYELASRLIAGETLMSKVLHDVSVAIDYLEQRKDVDLERVGFIGHSYGGRMALWAPVFDQRIKASVSNCGCINYKDSLSHDAGIQMEFCIPGILKVGDIEELITLIAPRALLISATDNDVWSRGAKEIYERALPAFPEGFLELNVYSGAHQFTSEMRENAYRFLEKHLSQPTVLQLPGHQT